MYMYSSNAVNSVRVRARTCTWHGARHRFATTNLVTLNIRSSLSARRTLTPNEVSVRNTDQITSNMLPTITLNEREQCQKR